MMILATRMYTKTLKMPLAPPRNPHRWLEFLRSLNAYVQALLSLEAIYLHVASATQNCQGCSCQSSEAASLACGGVLKARRCSGSGR